MLINYTHIMYLKGTNFCGFCGFGPKPQNLVPAKIFKCEKQRSNDSQRGSNFLSREESAKLSSRKKSENYEQQKLVLATISSGIGQKFHKQDKPD